MIRAENNDPQSTSACIFPLFDQGGAAYVAGLWKGYAEALADYAKEPSNAVSAMGSTWQGQRAALFDAWWAPIPDDVANLISVAHLMSDALRSFATAVPDINATVQKASSYVLQHLHVVSPNRLESTPPNGPPLLPGEGGPTTSQFMVEGLALVWTGGPLPAWYTSTFNSLSNDIKAAFDRAIRAAAAILAPAPGLLKQLVQLKEINRSSPAFGSGNPLGSLGDPTWNQLTGGGVFRPNLPPGFDSRPFGNQLVPAWYKPTTVMDIENFIANHADIAVALADVLLTAADAPWLAATLDAAVGIDGTVKAALKGDWVAAGVGAISLVLPAAGLAGESVKTFVEDLSFGETVKKLVVGGLDVGEDGITADIAEKIGESVQDKLNDYLIDQVQKKLGEPGDDGGTVTIPTSVIQQAIISSAEQYGVKVSLASSGIGPTSLDPDPKPKSTTAPHPTVLSGPPNAPTNPGTRLA